MDDEKVTTSISSFFNKSGDKIENITEDYELSASLQFHADQISSSASVKSAMDVGSGSGILMTELLKRGVEMVVGVELSESFNNLAKERLQKQDLLEKATFHTGSFLDLDLDPVDAVSFHSVICCHPDGQGMMNKSIALKPRVIVNSIPKDAIYLKMIFWIARRFSFLAGGFKPYIHSQKEIDLQLENAGYSLKYRETNGIMVSSTYHLSE